MIKKSDLKRTLGPGERLTIRDANGLMLVIRGNKGGTSRSFRVRYQVNGVRKETGLRTLGLDEARAEALRLSGLAKVTRDSGKAVPTLAQGVALFLEACPAEGPRMKQLRGLERRIALSPAGRILVTDLTVSQVHRALLVPLRGTPSVAREIAGLVTRTMRHLSLVLDTLPLRSFDALGKLVTSPPVRHRAAMTENIAANLRELNRYVTERDIPANVLYFRLLLLTLLRRGELAAVKLGDIDWENRILHIRRTKTIREGGFRVPLTLYAVRLLRAAVRFKKNNATDWLFDGKKGRHRDIRSGLLLGEFRDRQTLHGFRAVGRTWLAEHKFDFEAAEACLSHFRKDGTVSAYLRTDYLAERRELMQAWSDFLEPILEGPAQTVCSLFMDDTSVKRA